jgi:hypothetical protein
MKVVKLVERKVEQMAAHLAVMTVAMSAAKKVVLWVALKAALSVG